MWINLETKKQYANRLEAKRDLGHSTFNMMCKKGKLQFIPDK